LSGGGISDYADVSNFGGEGYQVTHFAAAKAQNQQFWREGISGYNKYQILTKYRITSKY
jgi:hypothetical protein